MTNLSSSEDGWVVLTRELSETPNWEKLTYANGIIEERPIAAHQLEIFDLSQPEFKGPTPGTVNLYFPGRRNTPYYRFSYRDGRRTKHVHIRGGNYSNSAARANANIIRDMVKRRAALQEILEQIAKF